MSDAARSIAARSAGLAVALVLAMVCWPGASPAADLISAPERCSPKTGCSFSATTYSMLTGESPTIAMPPVLDFPHDVVSSGRSVDGRTLFRSAQVGAGKSAVVEGAEYLDPGVYRFICSIHNFPTIYGTRMEADLVVLDGGAPPKPRPTIDLRLPRQSLVRVLRQGGLRVLARGDGTAKQVKLIARIGKRIVATKAGVALGSETFKPLRLRLRRDARRALRKRGSAVVSLVGAARFGEPRALRRRLR